MKTYTFITAVLASLFLVLGVNAKKPAISGHLKGLGNDSLKVEMMRIIPGEDNEDPERIPFSIPVKNGKFKLDDIGEYPVLLEIIPQSLIEIIPEGPLWLNSRMLEILLEPDDKVVIKGIVNANKSVDYEISGSDLNRELSHLRRMKLPWDAKADSINVLIERSSSPMELFVERNKLYEERRKFNYIHINNNPDAVSAGVVAVQLPLDSLEIYYAKLGEKAKSNFFADNYLKRNLKRAEEYRKVMAAKEYIVAGADAPRFTLKSADGTQVALTDVKDKYIVLDFWGTWCGPCMMGVPRMKSCYKHFKDKVEFIGIACNDTEKKWLETVAKEQLPWISLIEDPNDRISLEYAIEAYPTKIILDKDYRIVEIFQGEGDDFYIKLSELLK